MLLAKLWNIAEQKKTSNKETKERKKSYNKNSIYNENNQPEVAGFDAAAAPGGN